MFWNRNKKIKVLRNLWGKQIEKHRNFDLISSYHDLLQTEKSFSNSLVDDKTWSDLNFDSVFSKMDRNISGIGQQYLYHLLHKYESDENILKQRYGLSSYFKENSDLREKIQLKLLNLRGVSSYFISYLVLSKSLPYTKYYPVFYILSLASLVSILLISVNGIYLLVSMGILLTNIVINRIFSLKIYEYFSGFSGLNSLLQSAIAIGEIKTEQNIQEIVILKERKWILKSLKKKLGYLVIDKQNLGEFARAMIEYLNMFMLFDIIAYYRSVNVLLKNQEELHEIFKAVGSLDSSISSASYLEDVKNYCKPEFNTDDKITFEELNHPLLKYSVSNSLKDIKQSVLITGSNMSGKTTFIKTLGVNIILAQTLNFCLAEKISIPKLIVKTSIKRNEELEDGKSYFFVEIEAIKNFIDLADGKNTYLYLIDEIFRGTNTIERLASSTAVLKYLAENNRVFVTTHDIELQEMLQNTFSMCHFSEQVEDDKFFFDYKINQGPCTTGNAIKLLEIMQYPKTIVDEANSIAKNLLT